MYIVLIVLYVLLSVLLSTMYNFLSGWNPENLPVMAVYVPIFVFIWLILALITKVIDFENARLSVNWHKAFGINKGESKSLPDFFIAFWVWTLYGSLPIMLHWAAVLLSKFGYEVAGAILDAHRYASLLYVLITVIIGFNVLLVLDAVLKRFVRQ